jgi:cysteine synthase
MIIDPPLDLIFRDLFYRLRAFAGSHDIFLKLEGFNITGSIKIKTAIALGEIILIEDTHGKGHLSQAVGQMRRSIMIPID